MQIGILSFVQEQGGFRWQQLGLRLQKPSLRKSTTINHAREGLLSPSVPPPASGWDGVGKAKKKREGLGFGQERAKGGSLSTCIVFTDGVTEGGSLGSLMTHTTFGVTEGDPRAGSWLTSSFRFSSTGNQFVSIACARGSPHGLSRLQQSNQKTTWLWGFVGAGSFSPFPQHPRTLEVCKERGFFFQKKVQFPITQGGSSLFPVQARRPKGARQRLLGDAFGFGSRKKSCPFRDDQNSQKDL